MKLIVGLGNPEPRYQETRHNVGFVVLDRLADKYGLSYQQKDKFRALIAESTIAGQKVILVKPTTYYNLSGESVRSVADFYKVAPADILIIHDELALPLGTVRTRFGGSDAGNNGVKSVTQHIGIETGRVRIGIYTEHRDSMDDADFVLDKLGSDEKKILAEIEPKILSIVESFVDGTFIDTTHRG